jgi:prevent-host-death family protein
MMSVGIRELRQRASELLRHVERGETIEITDRGRPVAVLSPLPAGSAYERLVAEGDILRASSDSGELPEAMPVRPGQESASTVLARLRSDER